MFSKLHADFYRSAETTGFCRNGGPQVFCQITDKLKPADFLNFQHQKIKHFVKLF